MVNTFLQGFNDHSIGMFGLPVCSGVGKGYVIDLDTHLIIEIEKWLPVNVVPRSVIILLGMPNRWMTSFKKSTTFCAVAVTSGVYSIHLVNSSINILTYLKPPGALLKGPIISSPQHEKGHATIIV